MQPLGSPARVVVAGCGYWGQHLVRNIHALGALAGVVDADPRRAEEFGKRYEVPPLDYGAALQDGAIDAIVIAAPADMHAAMAGAALRAGKHVFVEKPLALRVHEGERLLLEAQRAGRTLMVGHLLQYHAAFLRLRSMVAAGELGRLQYIYSNRLNLGKIRREEDVFWSFAPHDISMILGLVGEDPETVTATGAAYLHKSLADVTTTHLAFPSGVHAHVFVSWLHPFKEQKLVVIGDHGMAVFDDRLDWSEKLKLFPHGVVWRNGNPEPIKADAVNVPVEESEPLRAECEHFLHCVTTGETPRTDGTEGLRVLRVLDRAAEQATGRRNERPAGGEAGRQHAGVFVHPSSFVDDGCQIGSGTKIWHFSHILSRTSIGRDVVIGQNVMIGPDVVVGDRCKIQNNVSLYAGITLEDGVFCGPSCVFTNVLNPRAEVERKNEFRTTRVGRGATIGANATIICGHDIGEYGFIAAGAVVTKGVPPYALMAGVPAKRIGWMSAAGERLGDDLVCPRTGERYRAIGDDQLVPDGKA